MLIKEIEEQDGMFTIHKAVAPSFYDYLCDLTVMFEAYPTKNDNQLHNVRLGMELIDKLEEVADRLPELPRDKENNEMELTEKQKNCPYCHGGYFKGKSGWQNANVFFSINNDGTLETMVDGAYGYVQGLVECPFCKRPLNEEDNE